MTTNRYAKMGKDRYAKGIPVPKPCHSDSPFIPVPKWLILTHIFLGLPVGRIDTVETVK
jgi:hypothetical protein